MSVDKIDNHEEIALKQRLEQWKQSPNIEAFIKVYTTQIQELEDAFHPMFLNRALANAIGQQLDEIGLIVGQAREGNNDDRYRTLLFVKIGQNISEGEPERIIDVFLLLSASEWVHYSNLNNAEIRLTGTAFFPDQDEVNFIFRNMQKVVAAGVRLNKILCAEIDDSFCYSGSNVDVDCVGYDDGTGTTGGKYAQEYTRKEDFAYAGIDPIAQGYGAQHLDPLAGGVYVA